LSIRQPKTENRQRLATGILAAVVTCVALTACRNDMHVQPKVLPLTHSDFYSDGRGSRTPPPATIARGQLRDDTYLYSGMINGQPANLMPFPATREVLERGRERFDIYCSPCHSRAGDGNGMIVQRGFRRPPSFYDPRLRQAPLGHFYDVMSNGFGAMPDYAAQVNTRDRWAIAAYIRALQASQTANAPAAQASPNVQIPGTAPSGATLPPGAALGVPERKK
jgi:mono/diheme cytochrome c family protein